ncbi:MAG: hypothetical protein ACI9TI_000429 [Natronomonas sp.]|jgi:hypothetical protein
MQCLDMLREYQTEHTRLVTGVSGPSLGTVVEAKTTASEVTGS